ncbi:MAG: hypothetical protein HRT40_00280 [Campylobacteraceae bacterium]|nr:hypothetical protein [Campylobacteraceae bacterium]
MKYLTIIIFLFISLNADKNWIKLDSNDMIDIEDKKNKKTFKASDINVLELIQGLQNPKKLLSKELGNNFIKLDKDDKKISSNHKVRKIYYKNGKTKLSITYLKNKKDGIQKEYYSNGSLMVKTYYLNGKKHGVETIYEEAGKIYKTKFYRYGKLQD